MVSRLKVSKLAQNAKRSKYNTCTSNENISSKFQRNSLGVKVKLDMKSPWGLYSQHCYLSDSSSIHIVFQTQKNDFITPSKCSTSPYLRFPTSNNEISNTYFSHFCRGIISIITFNNSNQVAKEKKCLVTRKVLLQHQTTRSTKCDNHKFNIWQSEGYFN